MVAGTRVLATESEVEQSQDRILAETVSEVPRPQSWDNHSSIGHRRDSDLLKTLPTLQLSERQRRDSRKDISM